MRKSKHTSFKRVEMVVVVEEEEEVCSTSLQYLQTSSKTTNNTKTNVECSKKKNECYKITCWKKWIMEMFLLMMIRMV